MNNTILVAGSINMDLVIKVRSIPKPGETISGGTFYRAYGGKGANQAVTVSRLGEECYFIGRVGKDVFGEELKENLLKNKVNIDYLVEDKDNPTGIAFIMVDNTGENSIVVAPGANSFLSQDNVRRCLPVISKARVLLTQLEIPVETVSFSLELAKKYDIVTILNPAPAKEIDPHILSLADIVTPNESELKTLTGIEPREERDVIRAGRKLLEYGVEIVVVTLGSKGAMMIERDSELYVPAMKVSAVDTTGAGDVFNGALAVRLADGDPVERALKYAVVSAGISVTRRGAQDSIPTMEEVDQFIREEMIEL